MPTLPFLLLSLYSRKCLEIPELRTPRNLFILFYDYFSFVFCYVRYTVESWEACEDSFITNAEEENRRLFSSIFVNKVKWREKILIDGLLRYPHQFLPHFPQFERKLFFVWEKNKSNDIIILCLNSCSRGCFI